MSSIFPLGSGEVAPPPPRKGGRGTALLVVILVLLAAGVGAVVIKSATHFFDGTPADFTGAGTGEVIAHVIPGATASDIGDELQAKGVVRSAAAFRAAARKDSRSLSLQPGYYRLRAQMKATLALALLLDPSSRLRSKVTIPEGASLQRTLALIAANTSGVSLSSLKAAAANPNALGLPTYAAGHVEGFLFPATYDIEPNTSAVEVLTLMTQRFAESASANQLEAGAKALGLTPLQVITMASIIERESAGPTDRGKVARVFLNRYHRGMSFGSEATVRYALGYPDRELTQSDIRIDSPYNTYRFAGFPPGPIGNPGDLAIQAALHPTEGTWLYFFTRSDGTTVFSHTSAEFDASQRGNG